MSEARRNTLIWIPIECKAALNIHRRYADSIAEYLRLTAQKAGVLISAAPLQTLERQGGRRLLNIPIYLATRGNVIRYAEEA